MYKNVNSTRLANIFVGTPRIFKIINIIKIRPFYRETRGCCIIDYYVIMPPGRLLKTQRFSINETITVCFRLWYVPRLI